MRNETNDRTTQCHSVYQKPYHEAAEVLDVFSARKILRLTVVALEHFKNVHLINCLK